MTEAERLETWDAAEYLRPDGHLHLCGPAQEALGSGDISTAVEIEVGAALRVYGVELDEADVRQVIIEETARRARAALDSIVEFSDPDGDLGPESAVELLALAQTLARACGVAS